MQGIIFLLTTKLYNDPDLLSGTVIWEVRAKIQQAIGPLEDLVTIIQGRKLQWPGHVSRSSGLAKTTLRGTVKGRRGHGRQRKRWKDKIKEWTGLEFSKFQRAVENREEW